MIALLLLTGCSGVFCVRHGVGAVQRLLLFGTVLLCCLTVAPVFLGAVGGATFGWLSIFLVICALMALAGSQWRSTPMFELTSDKSASAPQVTARSRALDLSSVTIAVLVVTLAILAMAVLGTVGWHLPILDSDGFYYHSTIADHLMTSGSTIVQRDGFNPWVYTYPGGFETFIGGLGILLKTTSHYNAMSAPLALIGGLGVTGICRVLGSNRAISSVAGGLFALSPIVLFQAFSTYVDVAFAVFTILSSYWATVAVRSTGGLRSTSEQSCPVIVASVLSGASMGLAIGTKGTGALYAAVLFVLLFGRFVLFSRAWIVVTGWLAGMVVVGGYWYVRNAVVFRNPLWPFAFGPLPSLFDPGAFLGSSPVGGSGFPAMVLTWFTEGREYSYDTYYGGFGWQWPLILAPILGVVIVVLVRRREFFRLLPLVSLLIPALFTPAVFRSRYVVAMLAAGLVAASQAWGWLANGSVPRQRLAVGGLGLTTVLAGYSGSAAYAQLPNRVSTSNASTFLSDTVRGLNLPARNSAFDWIDSLPKGSAVLLDRDRFLYTLPHEFAERDRDIAVRFTRFAPGNSNIDSAEFAVLANERWLEGRKEIVSFTTDGSTWRVYDLRTN
jgi:hypothetical protein